MRQWWRAVVRFFVEGLLDDLDMPQVLDMPDVTSPPGRPQRR